MAQPTRTKSRERLTADRHARLINHPVWRRIMDKVLFGYPPDGVLEDESSNHTTNAP